MATKPELNIAEYGKDISSVQYNDNFDKLNDYIEAISEELMLKVNTINSQLSTSILSKLQSIYPVGSLYIGTTDTCPIANLFGTWEKVSEGRVLQGVSGSQVAGGTVEAGLPNVWGNFSGCGKGYVGHGHTADFQGNGAFSIGGQSGLGGSDGLGGVQFYWCDFNASRSSSIYGKSNTVQPPAYLVNIWKRTA